MLPLKNLSPKSITAVLVITLAHPAFSAPATDKTSAALSASEFCRKIGQPVMTSSNMDVSSNQFSLLSNNAHSSRWQIHFSNQADVEVDSASGNITHYMNAAFFQHKSDQAEDKAMTREQAIQCATDALTATGVPLSELSLVEAAKSSRDQWNVVWKRVFHGIPYYRDNAIVEVQGVSGEIIGLGVNFHSSQPPILDNKISQEEAVSIAQEQLRAANLTNLPLKGGVGLIVEPNSFWQDGNERPVSGKSRSAWFCSFGQGEQFYAVWVDTATGDVIGGTMGGTLGGSTVKRQKPIFGHQLKRSITMVKIAK